MSKEKEQEERKKRIMQSLKPSVVDMIKKKKSNGKWECVEPCYIFEFMLCIFVLF